MQAPNDISGWMKRRALRTAWPAFTPPLEADHNLDISVVFTSLDATLPALHKAAGLAASLQARITLIVPQIVPYPLPLQSPTVLPEFNEASWRGIACRVPVETTVRIYLCRDRWEMLGMVLKPRSLLVVGYRKRWWPTAENRLARKLRQAGHEVIGYSPPPAVWPV